MSKKTRTAARHHPVRALLGCTAIVALTPVAALAQQTVVLDQVVIAGRQGDDDANSVVAATTTAGSKMPTPILDTPASVTVITAKDIQQRGATTAEEVLRYTAGVTTDYYGGDDRFDYYMIRGFNAYSYRDGLPIPKAFGGIREDAFAYERVEVLRGANSTAFGVSDPGGAVNYVTKLPRTMRFGEAYATIGSFDRAEIGVDFGDNLTADSTLSYRLTARVQKANTELDYGQDDGKLLMAGVSWRPSDATTLSMVADYLKRDGSTGSNFPLGTDYDRSTFFGDRDFNYVTNERRSITAILDHDFGGGLRANASMRYSDEDRGFGYVYIWDNDGLEPLDRYYFATKGTTESTVADANLQYERSLGRVKSRTMVGLQYQDTETTSRTWYTDYTQPGGIDLDVLDPYTGNDADNQITSAYLQQELTLDDRFIASFGLRHDRMDLSQTTLAGETTTADQNVTTSRLGLTYKVTPDLSTYFSYAESAVPASLTVEPEQGEQYEIGVKYRPQGMNALFTAAIYDLKKTNITRTDTSTGDPVPRTVGEIRARGLELEARAELSPVMNLTAAYSYTDTEITDDLSANSGNSLGNVPTHLASVWVDYTLAGQGGRGDMTFGLGARYKGTAYNDDANSGKSEAAVLLDAAYSYEFRKDTTLAVNVTNLLDEKHHEAASGAIAYNPGREVSLTLRRTW